MGSFDPLWVPILSHYRDGAPFALDRARTEDQIRHISPYVRQFLIAGTTGDGWGMTDAVLDDWIQLLQESSALSPRHRVLIGAFGATTEAVIERALRIETALGAWPLRADYAGLTVCAPVSESASQAEIAVHFQRILEATTSPLAIYQLPQVVGCEIAPETLAKLAQTSDRFTHFKDTSGADRVAMSGRLPGKTSLLRGAEGDYAAHLKPRGAYDGWLLSSANGFAPRLRTIADAAADGRMDEANAESGKLTGLVGSLFEAAATLSAGNPFSNANRAVDHIMAHGDSWDSVPARLSCGGTLPEPFLAQIAGLLRGAGEEISSGYRENGV